MVCEDGDESTPECDCDFVSSESSIWSETWTSFDCPFPASVFLQTKSVDGKASDSAFLD